MKRKLILFITITLLTNICRMVNKAGADAHLQ